MLRAALIGTAIVSAATIVATSAYRRRHHPARAWIQHASQQHRLRIENPLSRCFGASTGAAARSVAAESRAGRWAPSLRTCTGSAVAELVVAPFAFAAQISTPPEPAAEARERERVALSRLRTALQRVASLTADVPRNDDVPPDLRERIARACDDVAAEIDAEGAAFADLGEAARRSISWW